MGKAKDRTVLLPGRVLPEIREQMGMIQRVHRDDLARGSFLEAVMLG
jgi:hypothetical protein